MDVKGIYVLFCFCVLCCILIIIIDQRITNKVYFGTVSVCKEIQTGIPRLPCPALTKNSSYITATFDLPGLGNLMFQYASLLGIAQESDMVPVVPRDCKLNEIFQLQARKYNSSRPGKDWGEVLEHKACAFDPVLSRLYMKENVELVGYLQSWMYFQNAQEVVREHFQFTPAIQDKVERFFDQQLFRIFKNKAIDSASLTYIGVHIRRGDMMDPEKVKYGYTVADASYLARAVTVYEAMFPNEPIMFVVCSNDIQWAKRHFPAGRHYVIFSDDGNDDLTDLAILCHCNHSITSTGTFSWWAGWMAGGQVTYFKNFPRNHSRLASEFSANKMDYFLPNWIGL